MLSGWRDRCQGCLVAALVLAFCLSVTAAAEGQPTARPEEEALYALVRSFEVRPLPAEPDWARSAAPPLLRFAWLSDLHMDGGSRTPMIREACRTVREVVRPHLVIFTGDNCAYDPPATGERAALPLPHRRQLAFQEFLAAEVGLPAAVVPGDNWPWDFDKVFGPNRFSFDAAGLHLVFLAPDRRAKGAEGCAVFAPETWDWLNRDLSANRDRPTLVFMHENTVPPTFLDAPKLESALKSHPQVLATCTGHLHLDLELRRDGIAHLVCPAMARGGRPGFKVVELYPDRLVLNTWEHNPETEHFEPTLKWQRVDIPEGTLRQGLQPVDVARILRENRNDMPAAPLVEDAGLLQRRGELLFPMLQFLIAFGGQVVAP